MIDIEEDVFKAVATPLRAKYGKNIYLTGEAISRSSTFPCVSIIELDNTAYVASQNSDSNENHSTITYQVDVYSNKASGRKKECKEIMAIVDNVFGELGFTRIGKQPTTMNNATVFRLICRYIAVVGKDNYVYRR